MRILIFHVDHFSCTATQRGRSALVEPLAERTFTLEEGLLVLASVERGDESRQQEVVAGAAMEIRKLARQVGARRAMLHPFAHLFGLPADPQASVAVLDAVASALQTEGLECSRTPFGWFFSWELRAKGHPLSRVARRIPPLQETAAP
ncbi:MAG: hypothetical protein HY690_05980 [Chloroflexi bacterium]|nr:hypothetical protein [Chloroflexota bacterium]